MAEIFIKTREVKISVLQLWLNIKRKDAEDILKQLQELKIISTYKNGTYEILVSEKDLENVKNSIRKRLGKTNLIF